LLSDLRFAVFPSAHERDYSAGLSVSQVQHNPQIII
jgi:hypothetical protein